MNKALFFTLAVLLLAACNEKKPVVAEAETEATYDYRQAVQSYKLGSNALNNGDHLEAIGHLQKAVELDNANYRYQHWLGVAYSLNGELDKAETHLKESLRINPQHTESHNVLGTIYIEQERYDEAVASLRKVIKDKSYPEPKFGYFNLGKCLARQNRHEEAIAAYGLAVQYDPKFHRAHIALGEIYKQQKDYTQMLYHYQKAEPANANNVNVLFNIGYANFQLRNYDAAKRYLAQVTILFPPPAIDQPTQTMLRYINRVERN